MLIYFLNNLSARKINSSPVNQGNSKTALKKYNAF